LFPTELILLFLATIGGADADQTELAKRIREGDHEAFRTFFEQYHDQVLGYLRRRGLPDEVAADLTQQAFITIWDNRAQIDPAKSLRAYLYRIGYTRSLNYTRDTQKFMADVDLTQIPIAQSSNPEEEASYEDAQVMLRKAIEALPEKRRQVFEMCFISELTYREVSEMLDISIKTVESQMMHALRHIREEMKGFLDV
jgi:RNA polymerase sigma-70 factor (ECF subfamily)